LWAQRSIGEDEINDAAAIRNEWISPGFDPAEDIRLVFAPDGTLVGYIEAWTTAKPPCIPGFGAASTRTTAGWASAPGC
jgi:hypothetical protein